MVAVLVTISPLPWFFATPLTTYFVLMSNILSGSSWPVSDVCQQNLYLSHSPQVHRTMYIAVFLASINLFGIGLGNAVGGWLMQNPFTALAQARLSLLGMPLTNTRIMFLATIALRLLVMLLLLPRISEEGAWKMSDALADILRRTRDGARMRWFEARVWLLRRKARRAMDRDTQPDKEE